MYKSWPKTNNFTSDDLGVRFIFTPNKETKEEFEHRNSEFSKWITENVTIASDTKEFEGLTYA